MRPIVTDQVAWSVSQSLALGSTAKTAEVVEMPFGLRTQVGPTNHVLDWGPRPHANGQFWGMKGRPIVNYRNNTVICAKTAEPIQMPFVLWARMGPRNRVLDGIQSPHRKG